MAQFCKTSLVLLEHCLIVAVLDSFAIEQLLNQIVCLNEYQIITAALTFEGYYTNAFQPCNKWKFSAISQASSRQKKKRAEKKVCIAGLY